MGKPLVFATYPDLAGKRVLITGGGSGIGAGIVDAFVKQGAQVFFIDIVEDASRALVERLKDAKHAPVFFACDLTNLDALAKVIAQIEQDHGNIDVLINNAANDHRHEVHEVTGKYWDNSLAVNLRHQFFCAQAVATGMKNAGGGVILNFGSISWHLALPNLALYMTAKAAIEGLTRGLARDLGKDGIRVNTVIPGSVMTERQKALWHSPEAGQAILDSQVLPQPVEIEDIAAMALFLCSPAARNVTGQAISVDGNVEYL